MNLNKLNIDDTTIQATNLSALVNEFSCYPKENKIVEKRVAEYVLNNFFKLDLDESNTAVSSLKGKIVSLENSKKGFWNRVVNFFLFRTSRIDSEITRFGSIQQMLKVQQHFQSVTEKCNKKSQKEFEKIDVKIYETFVDYGTAIGLKDESIKTIFNSLKAEADLIISLQEIFISVESLGLKKLENDFSTNLKSLKKDIKKMRGTPHLLTEQEHESLSSRAIKARDQITLLQFTLLEQINNVKELINSVNKKYDNSFIEKSLKHCIHYYKIFTGCQVNFLNSSVIEIIDQAIPLWKQKLDTLENNLTETYNTAQKKCQNNHNNTLNEHVKNKRDSVGDEDDVELENETVKNEITETENNEITETEITETEITENEITETEENNELPPIRTLLSLMPDNFNVAEKFNKRDKSKDMYSYGNYVKIGEAKQNLLKKPDLLEFEEQIQKEINSLDASMGRSSNNNNNNNIVRTISKQSIDNLEITLTNMKTCLSRIKKEILRFDHSDSVDSDVETINGKQTKKTSDW